MQRLVVHEIQGPYIICLKRKPSTFYRQRPSAQGTESLGSLARSRFHPTWFNFSIVISTRCLNTSNKTSKIKALPSETRAVVCIFPRICHDSIRRLGNGWFSDHTPTGVRNKLNSKYLQFIYQASSTSRGICRSPTRYHDGNLAVFGAASTEFREGLDFRQ